MGEKVQLRAVKDSQGGGHVGAITGAMVATAIVFFPAAPLFLFVKGKDITIPKGTEVMAFVQGDTKLDMVSMVAPAAAPGAVSGGGAGASMASLTVTRRRREPIYGSAHSTGGREFCRNTPSTVSVTPGQHTIAVTKKGYAEWSRMMTVSGSGVRLSAELEKGAGTNCERRAHMLPGFSRPRKWPTLGCAEDGAPGFWVIRRFAEEEVDVLGHEEVAVDLEVVADAGLFERAFEEVVVTGEVGCPVVTREGEEVEVACLSVALQA